MNTGKLLFAGALLAAFGGIIAYYLSSKTSEDQGHLIPVGFGNPANNEIQFELAVSMFLPRRDPPKLKNGIVDWDDWAATHFELRDASGTVIPLRRSNFPKCMTEQLAGTPEFMLSTRVKPGASYKVDYIPVLGEPERYRYEFVAPSAPESGRKSFEPV